ncbi:uncharacterized protein METZ01_LOCUS320061, partial [marine metagenome]
MGAEGDKGAGWTTMKIDPEIFQELGVRDPEETKREMAISKRVRQVRKELKDKPDDIDLQLELGRLFIDGGELDEATKQLKQIISRDNQNGPAYKLLGTAYAMCNHEDEAIRELTRASELLPDDSEVHLNLGGVFMLQDMYESAARCFRKVVEIDPMDR